MMAPLMAPIEVPITHAGTIPASCMLWYAPTWNAPSAPPPCNTKTTWPGSAARFGLVPFADLTCATLLMFFSI